jgi:hypothetical protein
LIRWGSLAKGAVATIGGAISVGVGAVASTTVIGAVRGVPMVVGVIYNFEPDG